MAEKKQVTAKLEGNKLELPVGLVGLADIALHEPSRYALNAIHVAVEKHKARIEATDGRMLCRFVCDAPNCDDIDVLIRRDDWHTGLLINPKGAVTLEILADGDVCFTCDRRTLVVTPITGKFPKLDDVIPKYEDEDSTTGNLNPALLQALLTPLAEAIPELGTETPFSMTIPKGNPGRPLLITGHQPGTALTVQAAIMQTF